MTKKSDRAFTAPMASMRPLAGLPAEQPPRRLKSPDPLAAEVDMILVGGLNAGKEIVANTRASASMKEYKRVTRLIELFQKVHSLLPISSRKSRKKMDSLLCKLNSLSERYQWSPSYNLSDTGLSLSWRLPAPGRWEDRAVWCIRRLVENRTIHRLRPCSQCQSWFYGRTDHQRFCGETCRRKDASKSPVFKEKRRRYMAEVYRPRQKREEKESRRRLRRR